MRAPVNMPMGNSLRRTDRVHQYQACNTTRFGCKMVDRLPIDYGQHVPGQAHMMKPIGMAHSRTRVNCCCQPWDHSAVQLTCTNNETCVCDGAQPAALVSLTSVGHFESLPQPGLA